MSVPLSLLNQLIGARDADDCVRNLRGIVQDPFSDVDRVSVVRDAHADPGRSPASPLYEFLHLVVSNESENVESPFGASPQPDEPAWAEFLANLARVRDSTLEAYDLQVLRPCTVRGQHIGWLLFWRRMGASPISQRTTKAIDKRLPFASFLMMDLVRTTSSRGAVSGFFEAALDKIISEGVMGEKETGVVLRLMRGCSYGEIGRQMDISVNTVRKHVTRVFDKLEVHSALGIVNKYVLEPMLREAAGDKGLDRYMIMYP